MKGKWFDFNKMAELSNETEKLKKTNYNRLRKISEFSNISELSNETEKTRQIKFRTEKQV